MNILQINIMSARIRSGDAEEIFLSCLLNVSSKPHPLNILSYVLRKVANDNMVQNMIYNMVCFRIDKGRKAV